MNLEDMAYYELLERAEELGLDPTLFDTPDDLRFMIVDAEDEEFGSEYQGE